MPIRRKRRLFVVYCLSRFRKKCPKVLGRGSGRPGAQPPPRRGRGSGRPGSGRFSGRPPPPRRGRGRRPRLPFLRASARRLVLIYTEKKKTPSPGPLICRPLLFHAHFFRINLFDAERRRFSTDCDSSWSSLTVSSAS